MKPGLCSPGARAGLLAAVLLAGAVAGCSPTQYPASMRYPLRTDLLVGDGQAGTERRSLFPPGDLEASIRSLKDEPKAKVISPASLSQPEREQIRLGLRDIFGTPADPTVNVVGDGQDNLPPLTLLAASRYSRDNTPANGGRPVDVGQVDALELDKGSLKRGSSLYRRHCMHCHGVTGDGRGPTGPWVNPHPRDYRQGLFKFTSTATDINTRKPRRDDLLRTLHHGIDGTSMPAFGLLPERQVSQLVSYVTHLSLRGEVEFLTMQALIEKKDLDLDNTGTVDKLFAELYPDIKDQPIRKFVHWKATQLLVEWANASATKPMEPAAYPERFLLEAAPNKAERDKREQARHESIRNGLKLFQTKAECYTCHYDYGRQSPYKYDVWGTLVRPRNLTENQYRGGRRPVDLYWRLKGGIYPSGMSGLPGTVTPEEAWDLVNFVQALPYPAMLPEDVRNKVYPSRAKKAAATARASQP